MLEFTCWYYNVEREENSDNHFPNDLKIPRMNIWYIPVNLYKYKALIPQDRNLALSLLYPQHLLITLNYLTYSYIWRDPPYFE